MPCLTVRLCVARTCAWRTIPGRRPSTPRHRTPPAAGKKPCHLMRLCVAHTREWRIIPGRRPSTQPRRPPPVAREKPPSPAPTVRKPPVPCLSKRLCVARTRAWRITPGRRPSTKTTLTQHRREHVQPILGTILRDAVPMGQHMLWLAVYTAHRLNLRVALRPPAPAPPHVLWSLQNMAS